MMNMFSTLNISGSALTAEKLRLDVIAGNLANMNSTRSATDPTYPYRRRTVVFTEKLDEARARPRPYPRSRAATTTAPPYQPGKGVQVERIVLDRRPPRLVYDPEHPDANPETGYVAYPNVEVVKEMTDMITAHRSYEANATAARTAKEIYLKALEIGV